MHFGSWVAGRSSRVFAQGIAKDCGINDEHAKWIGRCTQLTISTSVAIVTFDVGGKALTLAELGTELVGEEAMSHLTDKSIEVVGEKTTSQVLNSLPFGDCETKAGMITDTLVDNSVDILVGKNSYRIGATKLCDSTGHVVDSLASSSRW